MGANFTGITFDDCNVSPSDDGLINRTILPDGILSGCEISYSGSTLTMASGTLIACGRQFRHPAAQNWAVVDATTGYARLLITLDLTKSATDQTFEQVADAVEYANDINGFPALVQQDINATGTKYQIVACVVSLGAGGISGIINTMPTVHPASADGGTLTVTAPGGSTVTVSKDGKTLTRAAGDDGVVVFRGLESGTWTLSITDGTQTASKTLEIVADYATSITFFAATIHITYPAGSTCTVTDGTTTLTAPDTSGTWACVVPNAGTWTITATSGVATKSDSVDISLDGQTVALTLYFETVLQPGGTWVIGNKGAYGGWLVGSLSNDGTSVTMYNSDYNRCVIARTDEKYDLTGIESITVHIVQNDTGHIAVLGVTDNDTYGWDAGSNNDTATIGGIAQTGNKEIGEITLDVSNITGSHYVAVACHRAGTVIFDSVKLNWKVN